MRIADMILPEEPMREAVIGQSLVESDFDEKIRESVKVYLEKPDWTRRLLLCFRRRHDAWWSTLEQDVDTPILTSDRRLLATGSKEPPWCAVGSLVSTTA